MDMTPNVEAFLDDDGHRPDQIPDVDGDPTSPDVSVDEVDLTPYPAASVEETLEASELHAAAGLKGSDDE